MFFIDFQVLQVIRIDLTPIMPYLCWFRFWSIWRLREHKRAQNWKWAKWVVWHIKSTLITLRVWISWWRCLRAHGSVASREVRGERPGVRIHHSLKVYFHPRKAQKPILLSITNSCRPHKVPRRSIIQMMSRFGALSILEHIFRAQTLPFVLVLACVE